MALLEDLTHGAAVRGILPDCLVTVIDATWVGTQIVNLTYRDPAGRLGSELLYRDREPTIEVVTTGRPWSFDGDGALLRLVSEAYRIDLAHLFDPLLAVHSSLIEPLPHQITAVYEEMLPRQPLRFLLADDPGAGKTIMTGLFIKELVSRGDLQRCLIVCPGSLVEQWQDELYRRFNLPFEIMTNDKLESARSGNWFTETPFAICRLDKLSRDDDVQAKLQQIDWDLIVCDEAHKMSATYFGGEIRYTKRYQLGRLLSGITRNFLLLTATPHNGKEEDFQLFMALLDGDRFEGKPGTGAHTADVSDLMRRLVKENLLKFDGTRLFPERIATTVTYKLSDREAALYRLVTDYVRGEFNRADALQNHGRKGTVGFALTVLQRRLASSPQAIFESLRRRRERLEKRRREEQILKRGGDVVGELFVGLPTITTDDLDDIEDAPDDELEELESRVVDQATAARTIHELEVEIQMLRGLEHLALQVLQSGTDKKWEELSNLLEDHAVMQDQAGNRRKLVIFTEHRDTLHYLARRIRGLLGHEQVVTIIHGGMGRDERRKAQEAFTQDREVEILLATDAAGEGINLQRAHLMVNYDLPWNPNRLEQRFGRIHRIGQTEVCHLWNLVAAETREGDVFQTLFAKLEQEREALGGQVYDVLGKVSFGDRPLRDLLIEAVRYGDSLEVKHRLHEIVDGALDRGHLLALIEEQSLVQSLLDTSRVQAVREQMERTEARRLQPHYIAAFFLEAFALLGGSVHEREHGRYEITRVPAAIRQRDRQIGMGEPLLARYERITFEKNLIALSGKPLAAFVCPGHPLLDAIIDLILERHRDLLRRGAVLIDPTDPGDGVRALVYIEHSIQDARIDRAGNRRVASRQVQFLELISTGAVHTAGYTPYLDYRPPAEDELPLLLPLADASWLSGGGEAAAIEHAAMELVPHHMNEVRPRRERLIEKTIVAVKERLNREIVHWRHRALELKAREDAGKANRLNSGNARQRADELELRLQKRLAELEQERRLSPLPPVVIGGALVVPAGLLATFRGGDDSQPEIAARENTRVQRMAIDTVLAAEAQLGYEATDRGSEHLGYDVESRVPGTGHLRFIAVRGFVLGARTITLIRNEMLSALNAPDQFILALVEVDDQTLTPRYFHLPFTKEPDFAVASVEFDLDELFASAVAPELAAESAGAFIPQIGVLS